MLKIHVLTEKEIRYQLGDPEIITIALEEAQHLKEQGYFKQFLIEIEECPPEDGLEGHYTLSVWVLSTSQTQLLGAPGNDASVIVDSCDLSPETLLDFTKRGKKLAKLLNQAAPQAKVDFVYPVE